MAHVRGRGERVEKKDLTELLRIEAGSNFLGDLARDPENLSRVRPGPIEMAEVSIWTNQAPHSPRPPMKKLSQLLECVPWLQRFLDLHRPKYLLRPIRRPPEPSRC